MRRMLTIIVVIICIVIIGCGTGFSGESFPQDFNTISYTEEEFKEDAEFLLKELEKRHSWLYDELLWAEYEWDFELFKQDISRGINDIWFYYEVSRLLAKIGDGVTKPVSGLAEDMQYRLPFTVMRLTEGYYVDSICNENEEYLGWELIAIDGVKISKLKEVLSEYVPYHNEVSLWKNLGANLNDYWLLFCTGVVRDMDVEITLSKDGKTEVIILRAEAVTELKEKDMAKLEATGENRKRDEYYYLEKQGEILYFQYNIADTDPEYPLKKLLVDMEEGLQNCKAFVIDLRYNDGLTGVGADLPIIKELLKKYTEKGLKLYCLIGNKTGGAVVERARDYKQWLGAVIVGESTVDSEIYFYEFKELVLLNSGITVRYPSKQRAPLRSSREKIEPDVKVIHTIDDYIAGVDRDMEKVKELMNE